MTCVPPAPVHLVDGLLLELVDLLVQGVLANRLQRARYPGRAPPLLAVPRQEKVQKVQQIDPPVTVRVESAPQGNGSSGRSHEASMEWNLEGVASIDIISVA